MTKGGGGVGKMLAIADKGGRGGLDPPPFLAYIIFEQPLIRQLEFLVSSYFLYFYIFDISMTNALIDSSLLLSDVPFQSPPDI